MALFCRWRLCTLTDGWQGLQTIWVQSQTDVSLKLISNFEDCLTPFFTVGRLVHWLPLGIAAQVPSTTPWHKNLTNSKLWHGKMNPTVGENSFNPGHHKLFGCCICHKWSYVPPAEEYQSVKPCEEQHNVCSKSALIYSDGSSFCVPHRQPYNASVPDQKKMFCEYVHFLNMSYIPWQRNKYCNCKLRGGIVTIKV